MTPEARFDELLQTARTDESIVGLILYSPGHQQQFSGDVEELARGAGHASVIDS